MKTPEAERLVLENQGLAIHIAVNFLKKRYQWNFNEYYDEATAEALAALVRAAADFDPANGSKFSAYAGATIRGALQNYYATSNIVKVPKQSHAISRLAFMTQLELEERLKRKPTTAELQAELYEICLRWAEERLSPEDKELTGEALEKAKWERLKRSTGTLAAVENIQTLMAAVSDVKSLDFEVNEEGLTLQEIIADHSLPEFGERLEVTEFRQAIADTLWSQCNAQQRALLLARYGFLTEDGKPISREVMGKAAGISGQAITMRQAKAIRMIRTSPRYEALRSHTDGGPEVAGRLPVAPVTLDEMIDEAKSLLEVA